MDVQCKCHGVSGSCEMRTCWRSLPRFRDVGTHLQELFHSAVQVEYINKHLVRKSALAQFTELTGEAGAGGEMNADALDPGAAVISKNMAARFLPNENDLLYFSPSPNFCHHNPNHGSLGTYGRQCSETSHGMDSCEYLCCGRGHRRQTFMHEEKCECKFYWCCEVRCETCRSTKVVSTCN
ncbi:unnamed protein product [Protopolystoma xenopodis]|uniref:Protein Wnt n=1 Tax=Protopolystoma xenopodis TaxID=117903 RepID=A0A448WAY7_9PLAT|nr:unnamed protein product [Protopolystoma xenopodis]